MLSFEFETLQSAARSSENNVLRVVRCIKDLGSTVLGVHRGWWHAALQLRITPMPLPLTWAIHGHLSPRSRDQDGSPGARMSNNLIAKASVGLDLERRPCREKNTTVTRRPWTQLFVFVVLDGLSGVISMFASIYCYGAQNGVYGASNIATVPQRCAPLFVRFVSFLPRFTTRSACSGSRSRHLSLDINAST
jgi:hypothetical protein